MWVGVSAPTQAVFLGLISREGLGRMVTQTKSNSVILLEKEMEYENVKFDEFALNQVFKQYALEDSEIEKCLTDGYDDQGIDAFCLFANGTLVTEELLQNDDKILKNFGEEFELKIYICQFKKEPSFKEKPIETIIASIDPLLSLDTYSNYPFHEVLQQQRELYIKFITHKKIMKLHPKKEVIVIYATMGSSQCIDPKIHKKANALVQRIEKMLPHSSTNVEFMGADELYNIFSKPKSATKTLLINKDSMSASYDLIDNSKAEGYVALVKLSDYSEFLTTHDNNLEEQFFDANVRAFLNKSEINGAVENTLQEDLSSDFWWLNNGVTILADKIQLTGRENLTLTNSRIVNGMQTSTCIFNYYKNNNFQLDPSDNRTVLIKALEIKETAIQEKIIKATNTQNNVGASDLRSTDPIHREIENHLKNHDFYYERRRQFYANQGKAKNKRISIADLAQTLHALFNHHPHESQSKPTSLLKTNKVYNKLFKNKEITLDNYLASTKLFKQIQQVTDKKHYERSVLLNFKFHILLTYFWLAIKEQPSTLNLTTTNADQIMNNHDTNLLQAYNTVKDAIKAYKVDEGVEGNNMISKSSKFTNYLTSKIQESLKS